MPLTVRVSAVGDQDMVIVIVRLSIVVQQQYDE